MNHPMPYDDSGVPDPYGPTRPANPSQPWDQTHHQQQPFPAPQFAPQPFYNQPYGPGYGFGGDPGAPFGRDPFTGEPLSDKSKATAGLLQLFLGGFGAGRFYLGSNGIAVTQLITLFVGWLLTLVLVGWLVLFGLGIWVIIDAIMMFTGAVRDPRGFKLRP